MITWSLSKMITKKRSDFFYTLNDDERKCLAYIERVDLKIKMRSSTSDLVECFSSADQSTDC